MNSRFGVADRAIIMPRIVEQHMFEQHVQRLWCFSFYVRRGLTLRTWQGEFMTIRLFKLLNFTASKYNSEWKLEGERGFSGAQLGSLVWPLGLHHEGSMPGFSVWSLITDTTGPLVVACVPSAACCKACLKCSLCMAALKEQRCSVRAVCCWAAAKNTTWRESHVEAKRFHSKIS